LNGLLLPPQGVVPRAGQLSWSTHFRANAPSWMMVSLITLFPVALNATSRGALDRKCVDQDGNKSPSAPIAFDLRVFAALWFKWAGQVLPKKREFLFKWREVPPRPREAEGFLKTSVDRSLGVLIKERVPPSVFMNIRLDLRRLIRFGLYLILLTPLLAWSGFLFPQVTAKTLAFQVLVEIVTAAALTTVLTSNLREKHGRPTLKGVSVLAFSLSLLLLYSAVTAFVGVDSHLSYWGFIDRQDGLVLWLHFLAWFGVLAWFYRKPADAADSKAKVHKDKSAGAPSRPSEGTIISYLNFSFWAAAAVAGTGLVEWAGERFLGVAPTVWKSIIAGRISGVFGNPIAAGPYLLFHFFYGIYYVWSRFAAGKRDVATRAGSAKTSWPGTAGIVAVELLFLTIMALGQSRGVLLGLIVALMLLALGAALVSAIPRWLKHATIVCVILAACAPFAAWRYRDALSQFPILNRLSFGRESVSVLMRRLTWTSALEGFKDHPVLGWGHDNVYHALNQYYDARHVEFNPRFTESRTTWYDKSHNAYIDLLAEKGIIGVAFFVSLVISLARALRRVPDRRLAICLACGFVAYGISDAVAFDTFGSMIGLFLFIAAVEVVAGPRASQPAIPRQERKELEKHGRDTRTLGMVRPITLSALMALLVLGLYMNGETAVANHKYLQAQDAFAADPSLGIQFYKEAFAHFSPYHTKQKLNCTYLILGNMINQRLTSDPYGSLELALQLAREVEEEKSPDAAIYMVLNDIYNSLALYGERRFVEQGRFLDKAEAAGKKALSLSPKRQEAMIYLGRTYILQNQPRRAVDLNRGMVAEYPHFPVAHWLLGLSLIASDQQEEAKAEIRKAFALGYRLQNEREAEQVRKLFGEAEFNELTRVR